MPLRLGRSARLGAALVALGAHLALAPAAGAPAGEHGAPAYPRFGEPWSGGPTALGGSRSSTPSTSAQAGRPS